MNRPSVAKVFAIRPLALCALGLCAAAHAHHSPSAFDMTARRSIFGVVREYQWANPHVYLYIETADDGGSRLWEVEGGALSMMRRRGWTENTFAAGERVTVTGNPGRNGDASILRLISVEKADGTELGVQELSFTLAPDGTDKADGLAGIWVADGGGPTWRLFTNPSLLPLTPRGRETVATYDETGDNQAADCVPYSIPMAMLLPDIKSIEVRPEAVVIRGEFDAMVRTIHLNMTSHEGAEAAYQGHSFGRWEGDALVVDTASFLPHSQGNATTLASGPRKHVVERFRPNPDGRSFTYSVLLEDPDFIEGSVGGDMQYRYRPDLDYSAVPCDLDNARRFLHYAVD
jgi:Family of unknown function (DUF6152)